MKKAIQLKKKVVSAGFMKICGNVDSVVNSIFTYT